MDWIGVGDHDGAREVEGREGFPLLALGSLVDGWLRGWLRVVEGGCWSESRGSSKGTKRLSSRSRLARWRQWAGEDERPRAVCGYLDGRVVFLVGIALGCAGNSSKVCVIEDSNYRQRSNSDCRQRSEHSA